MFRATMIRRMNGGYTASFASGANYTPGSEFGKLIT